ncbi:MAG: glycosyltransferase family 4 protein [Methanophagales archaeon]|nr:glycosyltransferase family 4 protein [Methanophagales archaeon]
MKIAFYYKSANNGIKTHVNALSREFVNLGHEVKKIDQFSLGSYMLGNTSGGISYGFDFSLRKIKKEVEDCDVLHIHHAATFSEFFLPLSSICSELNIVNTFHIPAGPSLEGELRKIHIATLTSLYAGRSKKFISVSAEIAEYIRRYCYGYNDGDNNNGTEIVIIPNGVDINRFHPPEEDEKESKKKERDVCIGYLGRLSPEKNIINMIKAVKVLASESWLDNVYLKIAGTGPLYNKIKKMEDEKIKVLGYVEDAPSFYRSLNIFLLPSKLEAQPIALLEAMASGLPIIATDVGDNKYFIQENGIICGTTAKEIGATIKEMLSEDLEKMGAESRRRVENGYTWDKIAERTLEVYKSVTNKSQFSN